jgi:P27 family predicted phage terminase small subunit
VSNQRQKDPALLINRRAGRGRGLTVLPRDDAFIVPAPPAGLRAAGRRAWRDFWTADVSAAVDIAADREDLEDWIKAIDERAKLRVTADKAPLVRGSHGQFMLNPLFRRLTTLDDKIQRYSDRFGMNPAARFRLQFTVSEAGKSANELLRMLTDSAVELPEVVSLDDL